MLLFVYGTLRSEFDNEYARMLRAGSESLGRAAVMGSIFRLGDYPGYRPHPPGEVHGDLYRLTDPERMLAILDAWEGPEFQRIPIRTSIGEDAWIYRFEGEPPPEQLIASGDFFPA